MNKKNFMIPFVVLFLVLGNVQGVMADNIGYLGHEYSGKVNNRNIPEGKGKIRIGELVIEGVFSDKIISNATFETEWLKYKGVVEYSRGNEITLKRGGIFTKYYYNKHEINITKHELPKEKYDLEAQSLKKKRKSIEETLIQDIKTDYEKLKKEKIRLTYAIKAVGIPSVLNPPEFLNSIEDSLKDCVIIGVKPKLSSRLASFSLNVVDYFAGTKLRSLSSPDSDLSKDIYAYIIDTTKSNNQVRIKQKDDKDRIWWYSYNSNNEKEQDVRYSVAYPDGSGYICDGSWGLAYPNGLVFFDRREPKTLKLNDGVVIKIKGYYNDLFVEEFVEYQAKKKKIVLPSRVEVILPENKNNLDSSALGQYLNNYVFALFQTPKLFEAEVYCTADYIGKFSNSQFISTKK